MAAVVAAAAALRWGDRAAAAGEGEEAETRMAGRRNCQWAEEEVAAVDICANKQTQEKEEKKRIFEDKEEEV